MWEKISEQHIRDEKIQKLKEKILSEIDKTSKRNKEYLKEAINKGDEMPPEEYPFYISKEYYLLELKKFINIKDIFNVYHAKYYKEDIAIYHISIELIDIWLQEKYNFVNNFLYHLEYAEEKLPLHNVLNTRFLGIDFTSCFDVIMYREQKEKEKQ